MLCYVLSCVWLFVTPWTVARQAPLSVGILEARILECVAMPSSRGSSRPRDGTQVSHITGDSLPPKPPGKPVLISKCPSLCAYLLSRALWWRRILWCFLGVFLSGTQACPSSALPISLTWVLLSYCANQLSNPNWKKNCSVSLLTYLHIPDNSQYRFQQMLYQSTKLSPLYINSWDQFGEATSKKA